MRIKSKLRLGFGFLFIAVLFFGATSLYYIQQIAQSANVILKNNYETLGYTKAMRTVLDENTLPLSAKAGAVFNHWLMRQEQNITEHGEAGATRQLRKYFVRLTTMPAGADSLQQLGRLIRRQLRTIETLNMQAITKKNDRAHAAVSHAGVVLGFIGSFTFLILFSFSISFPDIVAGPLRALLQGIQEISHKNYRHHLNFNRTDEFGELAVAFNSMASQLNEWENSNLATVMSEKRRIETIIEQMQDAIIGISEKQDLLFMNNAARNLLNLTDSKAVGKNATELMAGNELFNHILKMQAEPKPIKAMLNGNEAYFQLEKREITVPNLNPKPFDTINFTGKSAGRVYILKNVTEYKARDEAKTNFIATISHELKTPISSIKMSLQLLQDERIGAVNEEQQELIKHIEEDNHRLLKITSELLNMSQAETGNLQLTFTEVQPMQIVDYALNAVRFQAEQKKVQFNVVRNGQLPHVRADVEKAAWVMVNLLSNALRYSPENSKISIQLTKRKGYIEFSVRDNGKGIDEQYQQRLFDRYFQVPADDRNKSGSGLGLAISRDFIEAQNGTIWVESISGTGSTFTFSLPAVS